MSLDMPFISDPKYVPQAPSPVAGMGFTRNTVLEHVEKILQNLSVDEAPDIDGVSNVVMWEVVSLVA
ncbi:hypothetical protein QYM36_017528 [Artemia franciscana]|uniref:Uncharacterized protein n=1 Tax=Artemia franciscana TaxID=6661 RepID=A0AA88H678_ARTSF|nr:hypothetical protein QYM36_017528 [Artemia franciscana]